MLAGYKAGINLLVMHHGTRFKTPTTHETSMSTPPVAVTIASAPTPGEVENLEQAKYLKLAKPKRKQPKVELDKLAESNEGQQCG